MRGRVRKPFSNRCTIEIQVAVRKICLICMQSEEGTVKVLLPVA